MIILVRIPRLLQRLRPAGPAEDRLIRFRKVLTSAQDIPRYQTALQQANLYTSRTIAALRNVEDALRHFAVLELDDFRQSYAEFSTPRAPAQAPQKFLSPLKRPAKVAVFMDGFEEKGGVRRFTTDCTASLQQYQPEIIAAPVSVLRQLAACIRDGSLSVKPLNHAVVAFSGVGETLDVRDRDLFWQVFQVPLFEQYIGLDGRVIAHECEIHEGLHLLEEHAVIEQHDGEELLLTSLTDFRRPTLRLRTGYTGVIGRVLCECGRVEPRLMALTPVECAPLLSRKAAA